jgi:hypothetical protein
LPRRTPYNLWIVSWKRSLHPDLIYRGVFLEF